MRDARLALLVVCVPALAAADPGFEIKDRGDAVEVIAHDIKAARTGITPIRSRLEIPIVGKPAVARIAPPDATVHLVELDSDDGKASLSVKLNFERPDVRTLARYAQAIQVGDDLHVIVPRKVPAEGEVIKLPEPTLPPEIAAAIAVPQPTKIEVPKIEPKPAATPEAKPAIIQEAKPADPEPIAKAVKPTPPPRLAAEPEDAWMKLSGYGALGLAAAGVGVWLMRKRKANQAPVSTIEVLAQKSLGGKARIVWLAAGPREMVVSVTPQAVRMLGQWRKADGPAITPQLPFAHALPERATSQSEVTRAAQKPSSPAVAGLIRLRAQTAPPVAEINEEVATGDFDADSLWAKEILAATGGRR